MLLHQYEDVESILIFFFNGFFQLLRSSLVNNKTQSVVCDDLGMTKYAVYANPKVELKIKDRADLLEAFLGALYVDNVRVPRQTFDLELTLVCFVIN